MKKWMYNALIIFFSCVLIVSCFFLGKYYVDAYLQASRYQALSELRGNAPSTPRPIPTEQSNTDVTAGTENIEPTVPQPTLTTVTNPETGKQLQVLPEFAELYTMNPDLVGWLTVPGTVIDYPVMQTPSHPNYYLNRNFDEQYSARGCIYAQENCDVTAPSDNIVLYGHRMRDGSMFARLDNYMEKSFYEENPYIFFDTLDSLHTYKVLAVFLTTASVGEGFTYHTFVNADSEESFDRFVSSCKRLALYDTGVEAQYGDKLITLSTCEYSQTNGRLVIVAKRIL